MSALLLRSVLCARSLYVMVVFGCLALSGCLREESQQMHPCAPQSAGGALSSATANAPWWVGEWTIDRARLAAGHPPPQALLSSSLSTQEGERLHQPVPLNELPLSAAARELVLPILDRLSARWHFNIYASRLRWRRGEGQQTLSLTPLPGGRSLRIDEEGEEAGRLHCDESGLWWRWRAEAPLPLQRRGELENGRAREQ